MIRKRVFDIILFVLAKKKFDPTVNDLKCLQYTTEGLIYYKTGYHQENYESLPNRPNCSVKPFKKQKLYERRIPISKKKFDHLQELTQVLPAEVKKFYDDIPFCNKKQE